MLSIFYLLGLTSIVSIHEHDKGLKSIIEFCKKIRDNGILLPIAVEFEPVKDFCLLDKLYELGVTTVSINIEFLQEDVRRLLMPGKGKIDYTLYKENWAYAVNLFSKGQVFTNVLLIKFENDLKAMFKRIDDITAMGVIPSIGLLLPEKNTELEHIKMLDYDLQYKIHLYNTLCLIKNNLNPTQAKAGCPRNGSYSATNEFFTDYIYKERVLIADYGIYG